MFQVHAGISISFFTLEGQHKIRAKNVWWESGLYEWISGRYSFIPLSYLQFHYKLEGTKSHIHLK